MRRQNLFYRAISHGDYESPVPATSDGELNKSAHRLLKPLTGPSTRVVARPWARWACTSAHGR
jgi:hypothetical protein